MDLLRSEGKKLSVGAPELAGAIVGDGSRNGDGGRNGDNGRSERLLSVVRSGTA